jgi:hypothetical protein
MLGPVLKPGGELSHVALVALLSDDGLCARGLVLVHPKLGDFGGADGGTLKR